MRRPGFILDRVAEMKGFRDDRVRRLVLGAAAIVLALLTFYPRHYRAVVQLAPPEASSAALSSVLGQLGGNNNALLSTQPAEIDLSVARSIDVRREVARQLDLVGKRRGYGTPSATFVKLDRKVDVRALRGGIVQIEVHDTDPDFAVRLVDAYAQALRQRLSTLSQAQVSYKRRVLDERMAEAGARLDRAQAALSAFRRSNALPAPESELAQSVMTLNMLEGTIHAREVQLATELNFSTPENFTVKRLQSEIAVLRRQLDVARTRQYALGSPTAASLADVSQRYANLQRDLVFAQSLYQSYARYLEGSAVEELTARYNLEKLESTHLDPARQVNIVPLCLLIMVILMGVGAEFYIISPPAGSDRNQHPSSHE